MKIFVASFLLLISFVFATEQPFPIADLSPVIVNAVAMDAPGATIVDAFQTVGKTQTTYRIDAKIQDLDISYRLYLNMDGSLSKPIQSDGSVSPNLLPVVITNAVNTLTGGASITAAKQDSNGGIVTYKIWATRIPTRFYLVLNVDGTLNKPLHSETVVSAQNLPAPVLASLNTLVPNAIISRAVDITNGTVSVYQLTGSAGTTTFSVTLNADGSLNGLLLTEKPIATTDLPAPVLNTVLTNVSGAAITKILLITNGTKVSYRIVAEDIYSVYTLLEGPDGSLLTPVKTVTKISIPGLNLPTPVLQTIFQAAPGAVITAAKKFHKGNVTNYDISAITNVAHYHFILNEDGTYAKPIHIEQSLDPALLPAIVSKAALQAVTGGTITSALAVTDGTRILYYLNVAANGKTKRLVIDAGGVIVRASPSKRSL